MWTIRLCAFLAFVSFSAANIQSRIVNGQNTTIEEHPYQLSLELNEQHYCGAVLIRRNVALTGAHCFDR